MLKLKKTAPIIILWVFILSVLTGCKNIKDSVITPKPDLNKQYSCDFEADLYDDLKVSGTISRLGLSMWEMDITSPETMNGIHVSYDESGTEISLGDLNFSIEQENIKNNAVFKAIFDILDNFDTLTDMNISESENTYEYSGKYTLYTYILTFDKETMELTNISVNL